MTDTGDAPEAISALEDDRLQFFLEHRDLIRIWTALADDASVAVSVELRRLGGDIQEAASAAGIELSVAERVAGAEWSWAMLYRPAWMTPSADGPDIAVGLGWDGKVLPTEGWPGMTLPYVGIIASRESERGRRLEEIIRPIAKRELVDTKRYVKGTNWIAYRRFKANDDWYLDISGWRTSVVDEVINAWRECVPVVDRGLVDLSTP